MLPPGTTVDQYVIVNVLGEGGMGVVYEAHQPSLQRNVALKLIDPLIAGDPQFKTRFKREAVAQAAITHPHIVPVYDIGECPEGLFLAMQLVRGPTLKDLISSHALAPSESLELLAPIAAAIDAAHRAGLIHRDVKPQNVLISTERHPFLADFGITKALGGPSVTNAGAFVGTAAYAAPEQINGTATASSDIYALGATLFECLTERQPFPAASSAEAIKAHLDEPPPKPSALRAGLPRQLDAVIESALAKDPRMRPPTATALMADAARAFRGEEPEFPGDVTELTTTPFPPPHTERPGERSEQQLLLKRVSQSYSAFIDQTLGAAFRLDLELELQPDLTRRPSDRVLPAPRRGATLAPGTTIVDVFERAGGIQGDGLLVLGAPGAGKTTVLVELAYALAERARMDASHPVPVYVPLTSAGATRASFEDWLVEQISKLYKLSPAAALRTLDRGSPSALLLLDGLDEVADHATRVANAHAINAFASEYPLPVVVTSRPAEYKSLPTELDLETAVLIQPLLPEAVLERLREIPESQGVVTVIEHDPALLDLLTSPLLVSMLTVAYSGRAPTEIPLGGSTSTLAMLIDDFLERRFELEARAHTGGAAYPLDRTREWLKLLATTVTRRRVTIFLLERMQAEILPSRRAARFVRMAPKIAYGLLAGVIVCLVSARISKHLGFRELPSAHIFIWLAFGITAGLTQGWTTRRRTLAWLALGALSGVPYRVLIGKDTAEGLLYQSLYLAVFFAIVGELLIRLVPADLQPAERLKWSWRRARPHVLPGLAVGLVIGPIFGLLFGLTLQSQGADVGAPLYWSLLFGPLLGLLLAFCRDLGRALIPARRTARNRPNEGIRLSARYALVVMVTCFLGVQLATLAGVGIWIALGGRQEASGDELAVVFWLAGAWGAGSGVLLGMACGGGAVIQHWTLRLLLWRYGLAPRRLSHWLAFVVRLRILYWGVGGGHMFIHRVVQEHFAGRPADVERRADPPVK